MTATIPIPNRSSRNDHSDLPEVIIIESTLGGGGNSGPDPLSARPVASAPSSPGLRILRAIVAAIGIVFVCVLAVAFTFVWAILTIVSHALGRGRRASRSSGASAAGPSCPTPQAPVV
jgi:hypothetical protein